MKHTISVTVENRFGVLSRVAGLFSGRGFNIESLSVGETIDASVSRMTIVTRGDDRIIEQVIKQLRKLVDVIKVTDLTDLHFVDREMILIKVNATEKTKADILRINEIFRGKIVDVSPNTYTFEVTGDEGKIDAFIKLIKPFGVKEIAKTGKVAVSREM
ncbi:MAG: acetolactate synthase small subunit [bacterium]|nr:acetolactate synthase small subunit [bacterium]MDT8396886.1 acetolactate synthase small subunit [bacterium]